MTDSGVILSRNLPSESAIKKMYPSIVSVLFL